MWLDYLIMLNESITLSNTIRRLPIFFSSVFPGQLKK